MRRINSASRMLSAACSLYSATPYVFSPPGSALRSKMVTDAPCLRNSAAQASEAGPAPMQATRRSIGSERATGSSSREAWKKSIAWRCSRAIWMGSRL